jgi:hypothetical protein
MADARDGEGRVSRNGGGDVTSHADGGIGRIALRDATAGDAAALASLHVASWQESYAGIMPDAVLAHC